MENLPIKSTGEHRNFLDLSQYNYGRYRQAIFRWHEESIESLYGSQSSEESTWHMPSLRLLRHSADSSFT